MTTDVDVAAFTDFERAGWDRVAVPYHRFLGPVTSHVVEPLLNAAAVGRGSRVLDVATGPGYAAGAAAARGADVVGVDLSAEILALARRLQRGVTFRVADAAALPFPDGAFDAVTAGFLLPHLADHEGAVAEFVRVLAPGGAVSLSTWDRPERTPLFGAMAEAAAGAEAPPDLPVGPPFFTYSDEHALASLLESAGLTSVDVTTVSFTCRVPSAEALWEGLVGATVRTAALVGGQPPSVRHAIRQAFTAIVSGYEALGGLELPVSVKIGRGER